MKKRVLSLFMALALCLTLLPTAALAEETAENVAEVTISGGTPTQYADIEKAFTAAQGAKSATVKLLKDVTIPTNADGHSFGIQLTGGNITLDLNGCTIQTTGGASGFSQLEAVFYIEGSESSSSLTVQNSTGGGKIVQPNGGQAIHVGSNGTLTVKSGVTIEVTSTDESVSSPVIRDKNCAIFLNGGGTANILGGTLTGKQGIYVKNGTLSVSGGTIHGKNSYALQVAENAVANYNSMVTLTGGSYTTGLENGCSIWNADGTAAALLASGYRYQDNNGKESAYSEGGKGVVGNTTVHERPANEFAYMGADGTEQTHAGCTELTEAGFEGALAGDETWFAAKGNVTADGPLQVCGTVNLILCDGVTVKLNKGISLSGDAENVATLNIYAQSGGTGKLICGGASNSTNAGIYINAGTTCTTALNIYGGKITATGTSNPLFPGIFGAGIGSIGNDKYASTMTVNIFGGTVTAKSGGEGAQAIGNGTNGNGTVAVSIAKGMKCVRTDNLNTACDPGNTDGTSVTVTKCSEHEWEYKVEDDKHTKTCKLCGFDGVSETHKAEKYVSVSETQHDIYCVCGKKLGTEDHAVQYTPNADGLTHKTSCNRCSWTSPDEQHTFREDGACVCGIGKSAEYGGKEYASLQTAVNAAAASSGTVTLARDVSENVTVTGGTLTVDLNGKTWHVHEDVNSNIIQKTPLTVTGGSVTLKNGTISQELRTNGKCGIQITGGSVTVEGDAVVIGSNKDGSAQLPPAPAIELENGGLTLETGATLVYGLEVPEGKHLSDYLPEGTAFGLRSYDEATGTLTKDNGLLNAYTINNYAEHNMALVVVEHSAHDFKPGSDGKYVCACGYVCPHNDFKDGKCTSCGNGCAHKITESTDAAGNVTAAECTVCGAQMAVKITASDSTVTYGTDFKTAMNAAENGTTVKLLADIEWGVTPQSRAEITGDGKIVTLDLNGHTITGGWLDVGGKDTNETYTTCTLKIIGKGSYEPLTSGGGIITVDLKATLNLSEWEGGTISAINISDRSGYDPATREAAVIIGPKAGTIGELSFGNNQLEKLTKTRLSGGSFNKIEVADFGPVKLGELLADGYAFQNGDGSYVKYETTLQGASIPNVKVVKCLHPNMEPDAATGIATCEYCGKSGKFVASVDGNLYTDMKEAIDYWLANGGTLKLYADYTAADGTWKVGSGSHTINLNGHRMSVQDDSAFKLTNNMHLTVIDGTEIGQIENILLEGGSFTLESGYVGNLKMTGDAVVTLKGGRIDTLDVRNCSANTNLSIQGGSLGKLNIKDWADGMHVSATSGSLGAYSLPSGKVLADVLDHQYYAEGTSLNRQVGTAQKPEKFVIKQAPYDFGSTSKAAEVPINGRIPFRVDSPSENVGVYLVKWYRRTDSGAVHMVENKVAGVNVGDTLDVFCVITGVDRPNNGTVLWQVAVKGYTIKVVPADLSQGAVVFTQTAEGFAGTMGNIRDGKGTFVFTPFGGDVNNASTLTYCFEVSHDGQKLIEGKDYTIANSSNQAKYAGDHTLTIQGIGSYTGTATHTWRIEPYKLTRGNYRPPTITKVYDGTTGFDFSKDGNWGSFKENVANRPNDAGTGKNPVLGADETAISIYLKPEDLKASAVTLDSPDVGDRTASYTITLKARDGQSEPNFVFEDGEPPTIQVTAPAYITKAFLSSLPEAGELNVANNHAATYTVDLAALLPALEAPREYGAVTYGAPAVNLSSGYYAVSTARIENGKLILPIQAVKTDTTGSIGSVEVKVSTTNYHGFTLTINVNATNKIVPIGAPTLSKTTLAWGEQLSTIALSGAMTDPTDNTKTVKGKFEWVAPGAAKETIGEYQAEWKFTPTDAAVYAETSGTVTITVTKATPTGAPKYTAITTGGKTLTDAGLTVNEKWPEGTVQWVDENGVELDVSTEVKANTAYKWVFTPDDKEHYDELTGFITLYSVSGSSGGGGGSDSNPVIKTETKNHTDGSTTKTETKKDGTVIETTTAKDGSVSKTETKKDGSSVTENKAADGSTGTVKTDKNGQTTAETTLSNKAIEDAKRNGEAVKAPVEVEASRNSNTAPTVKVELPKDAGETEVEIPVSNAKPGTVAVIVHPDGTEEILKISVPTEGGIRLTVDGSATVKIVDNSKDFIDTRNHWAKDAIDFVSARELVNGISATRYAPDATATRAQMWTILARQNDADLSGGANWYEKAQLWSKDKGVSDGSNPSATINRAQMVTMLWRTMGQPAAGGSASFADVPADSYYAQAVAWAVESGITAGVGNGRFDPNSTCTRGQIATFLYRLYLSR